MRVVQDPLTDAARVAYEAIRAWQVVTDEPAPSPPWDEAPAWVRASAIDGARHVLNGARPQHLHDAWRDQRTAAGWVYGDVKDSIARTHPCLVPYEELPADQQRKDLLFWAVVRALTQPLREAVSL